MQIQEKQNNQTLITFIICNKKMLTQKQIQAFIEFYKWIYGDTSKKTGTGQLPHIKKEDEEKHKKMWYNFLESLIWPRKCKRMYTHKGWRQETILDYCFNNLWFGYWPIIDE